MEKVDKLNLKIKKHWHEIPKKLRMKQIDQKFLDTRRSILRRNMIASI